MDSTITNIAAPTIVRDIGGGESLIKWLGAGYALAMGVLLVLGGRLGDRYGKRRMFLIGIAGFTLASLGCGLAADPAMLIAGRLVQGGFGALLIPQGIGIVISSFSREQQPRAMAAFGPVLGASAVLGPIVAGFLISADIAGLTWRPIFLINIVLGTAGFLAALGMTPRAAAIALSPLVIGIIIASFVCRPLVGKLGRVLVIIGLATTLAGAAGLWATVLAEGTAVSAWALVPSILVLGAGMGACISSIYDVAIGDVAPAEAGSASGALSAVQQLAAAIGSAVVTTVYFSQQARHGAGHAMTVSVAVGGAIALLDLGLVWLLPKSAPGTVLTPICGILVRSPLHERRHEPHQRSSCHLDEQFQGVRFSVSRHVL